MSPNCKDAAMEKLRRLRISQSNTGKKHTESTKAKIREAHLGMPFPESAKQKLRDLRQGRFIGENSPLFGVAKTESHRNNLRLSRLGKFTGKDNPNWRGGITELVYAIRTCDRMRIWREGVFARDGYSDWFSGCAGNGNLEAHHITPLVALIRKYKILTIDDAARCKYLWDINNGITMLKTSHAAYHQMWGSPR